MADFVARQVHLMGTCLAGAESSQGSIDPVRKIPIFMAGSSALLNLYSTQPILKEITSDLHQGGSMGGWTISATTFAVALTAPLAGSISDRVGRKGVIVRALLGTSGATLLCAHAASFEMLILFRLLQGLFIPFVFAVTLAYLAEECAAGEAAQLNAIYVSGSIFGGFLGRFISGLVTYHYGWRASFIALLGYSLLTTLVLVLWLPRESRFVPLGAGLGSSLAYIPRHFRNRQLLATCMVGGSIMFVQVASFTYAGLHLAGPPFCFSSKALGMVFTVFLLGVAVTPMAGDWIAARGRIATFTSACAVSGAGLALCLLPHATTMVVGLALCSTGIFSGQACATGYAAVAAGPAKSSGVGLYLTFYYFFGSLGAVLPGPLFRRWGWEPCLGLMAIMLFAGVVAARLGWRTRGAPEAGPAG